MGQRQRRRRAAAIIAVVVVLAVLLPLTWLALRGDHQPPTVEPTPSPSTAWDKTPRAVSIPGVTFDRDRDMMLMDATHAWAYVDECPNTYPLVESCRSALGYSDDAGQTWRRVNMPDDTGQREYGMALDVDVRWLPFDANTLSLVTKDQVYLTKDRGATWTKHPLNDPPYEAQRAANLADNFGSNAGDYQYLCSGANILTMLGQSSLTTFNSGDWMATAGWSSQACSDPSKWPIQSC